MTEQPIGVYIPQQPSFRVASDPIRKLSPEEVKNMHIALEKLMAGTSYISGYTKDNARKIIAEIGLENVDQFFSMRSAGYGDDDAIRIMKKINPENVNRFLSIRSAGYSEADTIKIIENMNKLGELGDDGYKNVSVLRDAIVRRVDSPDPAVRRAACAALAEMGQPPASDASITAKRNFLRGILEAATPNNLLEGSPSGVCNASGGYVPAETGRSVVVYDGVAFLTGENGNAKFSQQVRCETDTQGQTRYFFYGLDDNGDVYAYECSLRGNELARPDLSAVDFASLADIGFSSAISDFGEANIRIAKVGDEYVLCYQHGDEVRQAHSAQGLYVVVDEKNNTYAIYRDRKPAQDPGQHGNMGVSLAQELALERIRALG